ncbi:hypothetical protein [Dasychira pudibunda nucleopolyhedrovirus]|nr:hypothetical protein [Dasychira pudibunda nucleopolyhedrovirus]WHM28346.1 hypothetical protein [Dasychira pudibunda nucleopolyhedrovirus]
MCRRCAHPTAKLVLQNTTRRCVKNFARVVFVVVSSTVSWGFVKFLCRGRICLCKSSAFNTTRKQAFVS